MDWNQKVVKLTGMWLASLVGAVYGLLFTIIGAGFDWGPGGGMEGPYWKILIVGLISLLLGMYAGELLVRKLSDALKVFSKPRSKAEIVLLMAFICFTASLVAWVISWEAGMITGIATGSIGWDEVINWGQVILDVGLMSLVFGVPFYLLAGIINAVVASIVLKK